MIKHISYSDIKECVDEAYDKFSNETGGKNASYIPFLAKVPSTLFGISVCLPDGQLIEKGDTAFRFGIESISKVPTALLVIFCDLPALRDGVYDHLLVLGLALGIAPVGAYIAVTGSFAAMPCLLALAVMTWTAGFDILYSMQDVAFDRSHALHSVPARFTLVQSTLISLALHAVALVAVIGIGAGYGFGWWYWIGTALFTVILVVQHILYRPSHIDRIGATFGLVNGLASVTYALLAIIDLLVR